MPFAPSLPRTAFIVDDDEIIRGALANVLRNLGYDVVGSAGSADAALELIPATRPSFAIIDIHLPDRSGVELAAELLKLTDLPIVFLTGLDDPDMGQLKGTNGVFGFLAKPASKTALRAMVELVRMQAEARQQLKQLEHHYHALFEQAAVGAAELDVVSGHLLEVNGKCARIFASTVSAMTERPLAERMTRDDERSAFEAALARLATGELTEHVAELWCRRDDDADVCVRITAAPLDARTPTHSVVMIEDVTDRKRIEAQLARERRVLADSQRNAEIGSFSVDFVSGEIVWSDETYRLHGVSRETFVPSYESIAQLIHPADRAVVMSGLSMENVPTDLLFSPLVYRVVLRGGGERKLRGTGQLQRNAAGMIEAMIGTVQNVTEAERALSERLEMESRERTAREANRAKTDFLAHMSHELRTPLNAVLGLSEALLERTFGELSDAQSNTIATIHNSGRHLLDLINDVLDIARVESGNLRLEADQVLLRPLIDESTALVYSQLTAKAQRLVIDLAPALPPVDVDRRRIKQVLLNLLGNAGKFSPPGTTVKLTAAMREDGREVELSVSDDGPGIAPEDRDRIFEPFVTLDPSMSRAHDGAGLGLTLAKRIVELHGGRIRVDSTPGKGATFTITLPSSVTYTHVEPEPRIDRSRALSPARARQTVLLAEDNEPTVFTISSYLASRGYDVRVVRDGNAALDAARDRDVAAVLMDIQLPGLDGLEVTRRLRAHADGASKPVIALTAHAMPGDEERCLESGASAYMAKPVRLRQLVVMLEHLLEERP